MSDDWIALIPEDPHFVPNAQARDRALVRFAEIAPGSDAIEVIVADVVQFFDCGANLERIGCPACRSEVPFAWWQKRLEEDDRDGFLRAKYNMPCCSTQLSLDALIYHWPQGFAKFALNAMNPNIGKLTDAHRQELEAILGTRLRVIYQHL